ncbi:MAG: HipA N-terminal domain-containing protein [Pseudonocardiales bacterium]|nr:HipA N-terminal domain-containing protein [Pseudonocardiales bacterium]
MAPEVTAGVYLGARRVGTLSFRSRIRVARMDVPRWFSNLLREPETPLRKLVADQFGVHAVRSFPLLVALGEDLPGAVVVRLDDASATALPGPEPGIERGGTSRVLPRRRPAQVLGRA